MIPVNTGWLGSWVYQRYTDDPFKWHSLQLSSNSWFFSDPHRMMWALTWSLCTLSSLLREWIVGVWPDTWGSSQSVYSSQDCVDNIDPLQSCCLARPFTWSDQAAGKGWCWMHSKDLVQRCWKWWVLGDGRLSAGRAPAPSHVGFSRLYQLLAFLLHLLIFSVLTDSLPKPANDHTDWETETVGKYVTHTWLGLTRWLSGHLPPSLKTGVQSLRPI